MTTTVELIHDGIEKSIRVAECAVHHHERSGWRRKEAASAVDAGPVVSLIHPDRASSDVPDA